MNTKRETLKQLRSRVDAFTKDLQARYSALPYISGQMLHYKGKSYMPLDTLSQLACAYTRLKDDFNTLLGIVGSEVRCKFLEGGDPIVY